MYHTVPWFTGAVPPGAPPLSLPFAAAPMLSALQTYQEQLDQDFLARFGVSPLTLPGARAAPTGAPCATAAATVGPSGGAGKKAAGDGGKTKAHATHSTLQDLNNARKTAPIFNRTMSAPADTPDARDAAHVDAARQHTTQLLRQSGDMAKIGSLLPRRRLLRPPSSLPPKTALEQWRTLRLGCGGCEHSL